MKNSKIAQLTSDYYDHHDYYSTMEALSMKDKGIDRVLDCIEERLRFENIPDPDKIMKIIREELEFEQIR